MHKENVKLTPKDMNNGFLWFFGICTLMKSHHSKTELLLHCQ